MNPQTESSSDEFSGRLGLIFATIGAAIGTGNIWRFPRMVGANGGGSFLVPWLIFLFVWSVPLIIAEFALGKRSRTGTVGTFRIFAGNNFAWMGLWTAWISTAIGFYYAVVTGWCLNYFQSAIRGGLGSEVDTVEVWNSFLQSPGQVVFFQLIAVLITMAAIWRGAKAIEKVNVILMVSLFILLFSALFLAFVMDLDDGTLDGFVYMFSIQPEYLMQPETWINGLSQSAWSCSAGMGMAITYSVYMRKDEDTTLNAATMCLANNSISIIAGLTVMMAVFAVVDDPLSAVGAGSSAITFLVLPEVFAQAPGGSGTTHHGHRILPRTFIRSTHLDDIHSGALCQELRQPRSGQIKGSGIHDCLDIPLRPAQCCIVDSHGLGNWSSIPAVPRSPGSHLGLRPDVQWALHRLQYLEVWMEQVQGVAGRERHQ